MYRTNRPEHIFGHVIEKYPDLIEPGLTFIESQYKINKQARLDGLWLDINNCYLISEYKTGNVINKDIAQGMKYLYIVDKSKELNGMGLGIPGKSRLVFVASGISPEIVIFFKFLKKNGFHDEGRMAIRVVDPTQWEWDLENESLKFPPPEIGRPLINTRELKDLEFPYKLPELFKPDPIKSDLMVDPNIKKQLMLDFFT